MKLPFTLRDRSAQGNFDKIAATLGERTYKTAFPFAAGWADYGGFFEAATCSRQGRLVVLQGLVSKTGGTPAATNTIGTLPSGFRPSATLVFVVGTGESFAAGRIDVQNTGAVVWQAGATTETDYTSLSGIVFVAA